MLCVFHCFYCRSRLRHVSRQGCTGRPADVASLSHAHAGTLTRLGQAFDELPMIATVNACLYTTMELQAGYVRCVSFMASIFTSTLTHLSAARQTGWKSSPRACVRLTFRRFLHLLRLFSPGVFHCRAELRPLPSFLLSIRCDFLLAFCQMRFLLAFCQMRFRRVLPHAIHNSANPSAVLLDLHYHLLVANCCILLARILPHPAALGMPDGRAEVAGAPLQVRGLHISRRLGAFLDA